jgi:hypothetical protein
MVEDLETRIVRALVDFVRKSRGRRVTVKASSLLRFAGLDGRHTDILKTAKVLGRLAHEGLVRVETRRKLSRSKVLKYCITESMDLWRLARENPDSTIGVLVERLRRLRNAPQGIQ